MLIPLSFDEIIINFVRNQGSRSYRLCSAARPIIFNSSLSMVSTAATSTVPCSVWLPRPPSQRHKLPLQSQAAQRWHTELLTRRDRLETQAFYTEQLPPFRFRAARSRAGRQYRQTSTCMLYRHFCPLC